MPVHCGSPSAAAFLILWSRSEPTPATFVSFQSIFSGFCMVFWLAALALLLPGKSRALAERFDANPRDLAKSLNGFKG